MPDANRQVFAHLDSIIEGVKSLREESDKGTDLGHLLTDVKEIDLQLWNVIERLEDTGDRHV